MSIRNPYKGNYNKSLSGTLGKVILAGGIIENIISGIVRDHSALPQ
jgi:hypothetical protein